MNVKEVPFNVEVLDAKPERFRLMKPVKAVDIFQGGTNNQFHDDGLFSVSIFGRVGSEDRDKRFSYIDCHVPVFHPFIYKQLIRLKGLYRAILSGKGYAIWNSKEKDFEQSDELNGDTGYYFFVKHWKEIVFKTTGSDIRDERIKLIEKYKDRSLTTRILVLPAGLRDVVVEEDGRFKQDEINDHYRRIISISNTIGGGGETPIIDTSRYSMQVAFNSLYDYIETMISGKRKFISHKWARRNVINGTRNVLTAMDTSVAVVGQQNTLTPNHTQVGLFQAIKGLLPVAKYNILNGWLKHAFGSTEGSALLVDKKTLKSKRVDVSSDTIDRWTTNDGIERVINSYGDREMRSRPVEIEDHYLGLVYTGPDNTFKVFGDIGELPEDRNKEDVYPITYVELLYLSMYNDWNKYGGFVSRYPIEAADSIYPTMLYIKTTIVGELRRELDENWVPYEDDDHIALEFPSRKQTEHMDSLAPHMCKLPGMKADFDGDMGSLNTTYSNNSQKEIRERLGQRDNYVAPDGSPRSPQTFEAIEIVIGALTGDP